MLIKIQDLYKDYIDDGLTTPALRGVSFEVAKGEFVAIMGASGSGKSTLMYIIGFLDKLTKGQYFFEGDDTSKFDDEKLAMIRNQKVGFVFQSYNLLPRTSVLDNILLPTIYTPNLDKDRAEKRAKKLLTQVKLDHRMDHKPNQLSGGEQQRAAIVRALMNEPSLILADEPTGNLDSKSGQEVMEVLQKLNDEGNTIVMVTHEQEVADCARRILLLKDGELIKDEKVRERKKAEDGIVK